MAMAVESWQIDEEKAAARGVCVCERETQTSRHMRAFMSFAFHCFPLRLSVIVRMGMAKH